MLKRLQGWLVDTYRRLVLSLVALGRSVKHYFWQTVATMNTVVTVTSFICGCVVTAWLSMASFNMQTLVILELCFNFLLETIVVGRNRGIIVVPPNADAHFRIFRLVGTALCLIGATCAVVRETILLQVLSHLLAANYLLEALIILVFEENLRLGPAYKDLANKL